MKDPPEPLTQSGMGKPSQDLALQILETLFERATEMEIAESPLVDAVAYAVVVFARSLGMPLTTVTNRLGLAAFLVEHQAKDQPSEAPPSSLN
jgi:hypothetical protein